VSALPSARAPSLCGHLPTRAAFEPIIVRIGSRHQAGRKPPDAQDDRAPRRSRKARDSANIASLSLQQTSARPARFCSTPNASSADTHRPFCAVGPHRQRTGSCQHAQSRLRTAPTPRLHGPTIRHHHTRSGFRSLPGQRTGHSGPAPWRTRRTSGELRTAGPVAEAMHVVDRSLQVCAPPIGALSSGRTSTA